MDAVKWDSEAAKSRSAGQYFRKMYFREVYSNNNDIMKAGVYETASGRIVAIDNRDMLDGTKVYSAPFVLNGPSGQSDLPRTFAANKDCIDVAKELAAEGLNPAVLNLADARIACGFYYRGSGAQEESLCRRTILSQSLYQYYEKDRAECVSVPFKGKGYPMDMRDGGIYSPKVMAFREVASKDFALLDDPFYLSFISVASLDFNERHGKDLDFMSADGSLSLEGLDIMKEKVRTIYRIAGQNGHDALVLGAWGCGAFRQDPETVSSLFDEVLHEEEFNGRFHTVCFAILDKDEEMNPVHKPFYDHFGSISK